MLFGFSESSVVQNLSPFWGFFFSTLILLFPKLLKPSEALKSPLESILAACRQSAFQKSSMQNQFVVRLASLGGLFS